MKQIRNLVKGLILSGIAIAMVSTVFAQSPVDSTVKVVRKKGPVRYTTGNGVWQPLEVGDVLKPGAIIQTGKEQDCFVDVVLGGSAVAAQVSRSTAFQPFLPSATTYYHGAASSQNVVRLWQNSALGIDKLTTLQSGAGEVSETQLDLKAGRISGSVNKLTPGSRYEIKLPNGVAGIRGTVYDITAEGILRVIEGTVVLSLVGADGNPTTLVVHAGEEFNPATAKVSTISPDAKTALSRQIGATRVVTPTPSTPVSMDRTIYNTMSTHAPFTPPGPPPSTPPVQH